MQLYFEKKLFTSIDLTIFDHFYIPLYNGAIDGAIPAASKGICLLSKAAKH